MSIILYCHNIKYRKTKKINLLELFRYPNLHDVSYICLVNTITVQNKIQLLITLNIHLIHNIQYLVLNQPSPYFKPQSILCHNVVLEFSTQSIIQI